METQLRHTVASASETPTKALSWLIEVEDRDMDELKPHERFEKLDFALGDTLMRVIKKPDWVQEVQRHTAEYQVVGQVILCGRQILKIVYGWYATREGCGAMYTIMDLTRLPFRGDQDMQWLYNEWARRVTHRRYELGEQQLRDILLAN